MDRQLTIMISRLSRCLGGHSVTLVEPPAPRRPVRPVKATAGGATAEAHDQPVSSWRHDDRGGDGARPLRAADDDASGWEMATQTGAGQSTHDYR